MPIEFAPPSPEVQPLSVPAPPYTNPLETLSEMGKLRAQQQALQTGALQQQSTQLELQQRRMELQSNQTLLNAFAQGGSYDDIYQRAAQSGQVLPQHLMALEQHRLDLQKEAALTDETTKKNLATDIDRYRGLLSGVTDQSSLDAANAQAQNLGVSPKIARITQFTDPDHVKAFSNSLATQSQIYGEAKTKAEAEKLGGEALVQRKQEAAQEMQAKQLPNGDIAPSDYVSILQNPRYKDVGLPPTGTKQSIDQFIGGLVPPKDQPEYQLKLAEVNAMKAYLSGGLPAINQQVDQIIPPTDAMNPKTKALLGAAMSRGDYESIKSILKDAYDYQKTIGVETSPTVIAARVGQKVAEAKAVAPIETAKAVATTEATEMAKARLSPDKFNQIIDPVARNRAIMQTQKYTEDYITKMNDAQKMLDMVDASRGGNQAAGGLIPLEEVRSIVARVNRQELEATSGGGSLLRRVENMLSQATSGKMSADQLRDLYQLGELQKQGAKRAYDASRAGTQTIYGVMPPEVDLTGIIKPAGPTTPSGGYFYAPLKSGRMAKFNSEEDFQKAKRAHPEIFK